LDAVWREWAVSWIPIAIFISALIIAAALRAASVTIAHAIRASNVLCEELNKLNNRHSGGSP
jgi:hypothetical protein